MTEKKQTNRVDASVIIATHNRAAILERTLEHLAGQEIEGLTWEVIVVDNGSTDDTERVLAEAAQKLPLVSLHEPVLGKNRALNQALKTARGNLLIFTDDDVIPCEKWVAELVGASARWPGDSLFGGPIIPDFPHDTPKWLQAPTFPYSEVAFSRYPPTCAGEGPTEHAPFGGNLAIRVSALLRDGYSESIGPCAGINYAMGSETELLRRLNADGLRYIYVPSASVQHVIRKEQTTRQWLFRRAFRFGRGRICMRPKTDQPCLLGAPRYLWRRLAVESVRYLFSSTRNQGRRIEAGMLLNRIRGQICEYRSLSRENPDEKPTAKAVRRKDQRASRFQADV